MDSQSHWTPAAPPPLSVLAPPAAPPPAPSAGPLTPEHMQDLALANQRAKKLRAAGGVAMFNGITIGVFSGFSFLFVLISPLMGEFDWLALVLGVGLGVIAWNELRGRTMLLRLDPRSPSVLGWNQLALLGLIVAYGAWMIGVTMLTPNPYTAMMAREPGLSDTLGDIGGLYQSLTLMVYGGVIVGTLLFQGLNALYYFRRGKMLRAYLAETPAWVVDLQRCQAGATVPPVA